MVNVGTYGQKVNIGTYGQMVNAGTYGQKMNVGTYGQKVNVGTYGQKVNVGTYGQKVNVGTYGQKVNIGTYGQMVNAGTYGQKANVGTYGQRVNVGTYGQMVNVWGNGQRVNVGHTDRRELQRLWTSNVYRPLEFLRTELQHVCERLALINDFSPAFTYFSGYDAVNSRQWAGADNTNKTGCACTLVGTCPTGHTCVCDAMSADRHTEGSFVTNKDRLPISSVTFGGATAQSQGTYRVGDFSCAPKPFSLPTTCHEARLLGYTTGEVLVWPHVTVDPFLVYCDMELVRNYEKVLSSTANWPNGQLILQHPTKQDYLRKAPPANLNTQYTCQGNQLAPNVNGVGLAVKNILYNKLDGPHAISDGVTIVQTTLPANTTAATRLAIHYRQASYAQMKALVNAATFCYMPVRYDCIATQFMGVASVSNYFVGQDGGRWRHFGSSTGTTTCSCGATSRCGGHDGHAHMVDRQCNCDVGDNQWRRDAGILTNKRALPLKEFVLDVGNNVNASAFLTLGHLHCINKKHDFNECQMGFHDCHEQADCVNEADHFECVCRDGWRALGVPREWANGRECFDDDECALEKCPFTATCVNTPGSFVCSCKPGFRHISPTECEDTNECAEATHRCDLNANCHNTFGGYFCTCKDSYRGDGFSCEGNRHTSHCCLCCAL
ncbi:hypothetical protein LSAT2_012815 [Lamellibrachia satsuma]|nr:hypothetical protein LSAT2_012815 [Lamellibrachia satsuma]